MLVDCPPAVSPLVILRADIGGFGRPNSRVTLSQAKHPKDRAVK